MDESVWQIENLIKKAVNRTKDRFLSYFLAWGIGFGIGLLSILILMFLAGLVVLIYFLFKSVWLTVFFGIAIGIFDFVAFMYISSWINLSTVAVLIQEEKIGIGATFKAVRPLVWSYVGLSFFCFLFMLGLIPFGFLSVFIVFFLWWLWAGFMPFVFLEQKRKGLDNLWISRQMFLQKAWGIFGRLLFVALVFVAVSFLVSLTGRNAGTSGLSIILSILYTPFTLAFHYEIYRNLAVPVEVKKPKTWITLAAVGWILLVVGLGIGVFALGQAAPGWLEQMSNSPAPNWIENLLPTPTVAAFKMPTI